MCEQMFPNTKIEFIHHVPKHEEIKCATIKYKYEEGGKQKVLMAELKVGYDDEDYSKFLDLLNFQYYNGRGKEKLTGKIWYKSGRWSLKKSRNNFHRWEYIKAPPIPESLL